MLFCYSRLRVYYGIAMKFVLLLCACAVVSSALELPSLKLLLEQKHQLRTNPGEQSSLKKRSEAQLDKRLWLGSVVHSIEHAAHNVGHAVEHAVHNVVHAVHDVGHAAQDVGHAVGDIVG
ncbi:uncharacterized protein LOC112577443 [Pomacea canaliculata]|uniref:uncharacterized protein LOC112577443 n=1 Tax=Pomacea canaliculata TaxID=400727 RepID=UPI000D7356FB|nr:uncharacterized protein LOC112577443 [Pomacea canaliculata]